MLLREKDLLQELVRIPSVNPVLCRDPLQGGGEGKLTNFLTDFSENNGWAWLRQTVHPGRDNLVAIGRGGSSAADSDVILWEAHQDTVGVAGMQIDPFAASERAGRIWGRGACDVKGGMAAMLAALARVQDQPARQRSTIVLALTVDEECGFTGAKALGQLWSQDVANATNPGAISGPLSLEELRILRPRRAIVAEPTGLNVVVAHKGVVRWRCHAHGRAAHCSRPEQGVNAIYAMSEVIRAIERFQQEVLSTRAAHPLSGGPSVCVSTIHGGTGVNTVPDEAVMDIDRRLAAAEQPADACRELIDYVAQHTASGEATIEHEPPWLESQGLDDRHNREWGERLATVVRSAGSACELVGVPYGTNAPAIAVCGIPTVVFGPGSIDQAHTADEWLDIEQLSRATDAFYRLACD